MASDLNKCCFIGWLARSPEVKNLNDGKVMATFSIAVGESRIDAGGNKVKTTEWINVISFGKLAEICAKYLGKGSQVYLEGKFKTSKYLAKDGTERQSVQIVLASLQMLGARVTKSADSQPAEVPVSSNEFDMDEIPF